MSVNGLPENGLEAPAIADAAGTTSDTFPANETNGDASQSAAPVAVGQKKRRATLSNAERPAHPGPLTWIDPTAEVCALAKDGRTVEAIAEASGLTHCQVEGVLDRAGVRRLHAPPRKILHRKFDRAAVRAAHASGESRNAIATRLCVSLASVSLAINEKRVGS